uniref:Na(+)/H(+) antiporter NhaA n=2 Tax=unclassified Prevotella TaxID=2638335 RepID=A0AB33J3W4_9BACT
MIQHYQQAIGRRVFMPIQLFMQKERASSIVLGLSVIIALLLANSPWREAYFAFFEQHFGFIWNGEPYLNFSLEHWVNDGLMSIFFFVIGLELKREFIGGELRHVRQVVLPIGAAVFGMLIPSLIYLVFNAGTPVAHGWGIPMATDIAFALAVLYLLGDRVPLSAKIFLTTLAIVDDLGSVLVIALFYTSNISMVSIGVGMLFLLLMFVGNKLGVKNVWFYGLIGVGGVWVCFLMSGVHATISAVLSAFMIPADSSIPEAAFIARLKRRMKNFEEAESNDVITLEEEQVEIISSVKRDTRNAIPPLQRLEHSIQPFVSFVIMPIFALANAGVSFVDMDTSMIFENHVAIGVMLGLLLGKPIGILSSVWLLTKLKIGKRDKAMSWRVLAGLGFLASIGFTMSMFVSVLAFTDSGSIVLAKIGIFAASILGGIIGYLLLRRA